jgi:hypothetical protein
VLPPPSELSVFVDVPLVVHAAVEVSAAIVERQTGQPSTVGAPGTVVLRVAEADSATISLALGDFAPPSEGAAKTAFAIAGGGFRLALARALLQIAGASLRLGQTNGLAHFAIHVPRAPVTQP